jgi:lipid A 3-O-deacylase
MIKPSFSCAAGCLLFWVSFLRAEEEIPSELEKPSERWSLNLYYENDLFANTDQQYTNGTKISWVSPDVTQYVNTDFPVLTKWVDRNIHFVSDEYNDKNLAFSIGQNMYTPEDIATTELVENDRPYAAWLYLSAGFHAKNDRIQDTFEIQLGMVGPAALGKQIQDFVHDVRDIPKANGWENQINNELGLNLVAERRVRFVPDNTGKGWEADAIGSGGIVLGNVSTFLNLGIEGRVGYNLPQDFGTTHIHPGGETNIPYIAERYRGRREEQNFGFLLFASMEGKAVARDIFLDGNTFSSSHSVTKETLIADLAVGVKFKLRAFKVSYALVHRTK